MTKQVRRERVQRFDQRPPRPTSGEVLGEVLDPAEQRGDDPVIGLELINCRPKLWCRCADGGEQDVVLAAVMGAEGSGNS